MYWILFFISRSVPSLKTFLNIINSAVNLSTSYHAKQIFVKWILQKEGGNSGVLVTDVSAAHFTIVMHQVSKIMILWRISKPWFCSTIQDHGSAAHFHHCDAASFQNHDFVAHFQKHDFAAHFKTMVPQRILPLWCIKFPKSWFCSAFQDHNMILQHNSRPWFCSAFYHCDAASFHNLDFAEFPHLPPNFGFSKVGGFRGARVLISKGN